MFRQIIACGILASFNWSVRSWL